MAPQLRIVVTGDTNSGKSTLSNAVIGRDLLPVSFQSETSVITYVVPQHVDEDAVPVLHSYSRGDQGLSELRPVAEGQDAVRSCLEQLNRKARARGDPECIECRVDCPLRSSLNVFVPPASEWQDVQFLDIGGADEVLNTKVQVCADLAYALSHRLIVCVRFDQTSSRATQRLVEDIRSRAPYHFDDALASRDKCPLIFVITQVDQALSDVEGIEQIEIMRQNLRALLHTTLADCPELVQNAPIVAVSAKNAMLNAERAEVDRPVYEWTLTDCPELVQNAPIVAASAKNAMLDAERAEGDRPVYEWPVFEELLILCAGLKRDIIRACRARRADFIRKLNARNLACMQEEWPYHALSLWRARRDLGVRVVLGSAVAAGSVGTAIAVGVYLSAASTAGMAAAQAASATAEASAATAAANSWWAWMFGLGQYGTAAAAASSAAAAAEAGAASAAATASIWGIGSAVAGVSTGLTLTAAAAHGLALGPATPGVTTVAGMTVVHAAAVGARDMRMALRGFKFSASASKIKNGEHYRDVAFYPAGATHLAGPQALGLTHFPFQLRNAKHGKTLYSDGAQVGCSSSQDRSDQLWWAVPGPEQGTFVLQSSESLCNLRADTSWLAIDRRLAVRCTAEVPGQTWRVLPGGREGTVRLQNVERAQCLFHDGVWTGCWSEVYPDQDWLVIPKVPFYVGDFKQKLMSGQGQFFWPNGAPLFKGEVSKGRLRKGFVFDERCVCHGHFHFGKDGAKLDGVQPDEVDSQATCVTCNKSATMVMMGKALKPCGHGITCEACAHTARECPYCRAPIEGTMRLT